MKTEELTFTPGGGAYGLEDEYMADIVVGGIDKGIIACQAASEPVAKALRQLVIDRMLGYPVALAAIKSVAINCVGDEEIRRLHELLTSSALPIESVTEQDLWGRIEQLEEEAATLAAHAADLERENADLKQRLHQMDARRDASQGLARSLAEYGHDFSYPVESVPGSMDPSCSTIGIDSEGGQS